MKTLRKVPIIGWLIGGIAVLLCVVWWLWRRLAIAQARIRVDAQLRKSREMSTRAARSIVRGHQERAREMAIESENRKKFYEKKRDEIQARAQKLEGISKAVNAAFSGSP